MFCSSCGVEMPEHFRFCPQCGASVSLGQCKAVMSPLRRSRDDKKVAGVCAGLARYLCLDVTLVRILVLCAGVWGVGVLFYFVCWIVMPPDTLSLAAPTANQVSNAPVAG